MEKAPRNVIFAMPRPMIEAAKKISLLNEILKKYDCFAYFTQHAYCLKQCTDQTIIMYVPRNFELDTVKFLQEHWEDENLYLIFGDSWTSASVS